MLDERLLFHDLLLKKKLILIPKAMKPPMLLVKSPLYFTGCVADLATHTHTHTHTSIAEILFILLTFSKIKMFC